MPKCDHDNQGISTHGRCLDCGEQVFTSKVLNRAGIPEHCTIARHFGRLTAPIYRKIERGEA